MTPWALIVNECSGCRDFPCVCSGPVTVQCICGEFLTAVDTLEDKRRVHTLHVTSTRHQLYRDLRRERPTAVPDVRDLSAAPSRASAAAVVGRG